MRVQARSRGDSTMQITAVIVLVCLASVRASSASKLPPWITACYRDDPEFDACAMKNSQACLKRLVQGDRKLQIPLLDPLDIVELKVDKEATSLGLDTVMTKIKLIGLTEAVFKKMHFDFEKKHISYTLSLPRIEMLFQYSIAGKILILPITGQGPGNMTMEDTTIVYDVDYDLVKKKAKDHIMLKNDKMAFEPSRLYVKLENLFNGDKLLGDNMNAFMNEQWREMLKELGPLVSEALGTIMTHILSLVADQVPYDDVVPLTPKTVT